MEGLNRKPQEEKGAFSNFFEKTNKVAGATVLGVGIAVGGMAVPEDVEARVVVSTAKDNPAIAQAEKNLQEIGVQKGQVVRDLFGNRLVLEFKDGRKLEVHGGKTTIEDLVAKATPQRIVFEISAREAEKDGSVEPLQETVRNTTITMSSYARSLINHLGITYQDGVLKTSEGKIDLTGGSIKNDRVEIKGVELENQLSACVFEVRMATLPTNDNGASRIKQYTILIHGTVLDVRQEPTSEALKNCR